MSSKSMEKKQAPWKQMVPVYLLAIGIPLVHGLNQKYGILESEYVPRPETSKIEHKLTAQEQEAIGHLNAMLLP